MSENSELDPNVYTTWQERRKKTGKEKAEIQGLAQVSRAENRRGATSRDEVHEVRRDPHCQPGSAVRWCGGLRPTRLSAPATRQRSGAEVLARPAPTGAALGPVPHAAGKPRDIL